MRSLLKMRPTAQLATGLVAIALAVLVAIYVGPAVANVFAPVNVGELPTVDLGLGANPVGPSAPAVPGVVPERIRIAKLSIDAPVAPVPATEGVLQVPADPQALGWWADGAAPAASRGTAVLAGHINSAKLGPGALADLRELLPGDEVVIVGGGQELRFVVTALRQYAKDSLPAADAFNQAVLGRLAIVSCGGQLDERTGHYPDNIVAYAELAP